MRSHPIQTQVNGRLYCEFTIARAILLSLETERLRLKYFQTNKQQLTTLSDELVSIFCHFQHK